MGGWREAGLLAIGRVASSVPSKVQVTVSILGGMMDDDRVTSVRGDQLTVTDHGKIRANRRLAPGDC